MLRSGFVISIWILLAAPTPLSAQIKKLTDESSFSDKAFGFAFGGIAGSDASDSLSALGVSITGEGSSRPIRDSIIIRNLIPPDFASVLRNQPGGTSSAGEALIVRFRHPLKRVGFLLSNGSATTVATIRAFTVKGEPLGSVQQGQISEKLGPFLGVETTHPAGISTVVLDYGEDPRAEQIGVLQFEFLSTPTFETCVAQIADGQAGGLTVRTSLQILDIFLGRSRQVRMRLFDPGGVPLRLTMNGETSDTFEFNLSFNFSVEHFETPGAAGPIKVGYACIESALPVSVQAIYRTFGPDGRLLSEAGIEGDVGKTSSKAAVERNLQEDLNTGIAIANPNATESRVEVFLNDAKGALLQPPFFDVLTIILPPGHQRAFFITDLFPVLKERDFRGALIVSSREAVSVTVLRTLGGIASSSLPVGSTQR